MRIISGEVPNSEELLAKVKQLTAENDRLKSDHSVPELFKNISYGPPFSINHHSQY